MTEIAIGQLIWFAIGAAVGASGAVAWRWSTGRLKPEKRVQVTLNWDDIKRGLAADDRIVNQVTNLVNWRLIQQVVYAEGYQLIFRGDEQVTPKAH